MRVVRFPVTGIGARGGARDLLSFDAIFRRKANRRYDIFRSAIDVNHLLRDSPENTCDHYADLFMMLRDHVDSAANPVMARMASAQPATAVLPIRVLIVGGGGNVRWMWTRHLMEQGFVVNTVTTEDEAIDRLRTRAYDVVVVDLSDQRDAAPGISDYANVRRPHAQLIFISSHDYVADGLTFQMCSNACAMVPAHGYPSDLSAVVQHFAERGRKAQPRP